MRQNGISNPQPARLWLDLWFLGGLIQALIIGVLQDMLVESKPTFALPPAPEPIIVLRAVPYLPILTLVYILFGCVAFRRHAWTVAFYATLIAGCSVVASTVFALGRL